MRKTPTTADMNVQQIIRFGGVGIFNTLFYLLLSMIFSGPIGLRAAFASVLSYILAAVAGFFLHRHFVFKSGNKAFSDAPRFFLVTAFGIAVSYVLPFIATERYGVPALLSYLMVSAAVPVLTYLLLRFFVFRAR